jgi:hypothetical protein
VHHRPLQSRRGAAPSLFPSPHMSEGAERRDGADRWALSEGARGPLRSGPLASRRSTVAIFCDVTVQDGAVFQAVLPRPFTRSHRPPKAAPSSGADDDVAPWDVVTGHACRRHTLLRQLSVPRRRPHLSPTEAHDEQGKIADTRESPNRKPKIRLAVSRPHGVRSVAKQRVSNHGRARMAQQRGRPPFETHRTAAECTQAAPALAMLLRVRRLCRTIHPAQKLRRLPKKSADGSDRASPRF